jgi:hypothetical protein
MVCCPRPTGADTGINDDRRATIDMQGVFHGQCKESTDEERRHRHLKA